MANSLLEHPDTITPSQADAELAKSLVRSLDEVLRAHRGGADDANTIRLTAHANGATEEMEAPVAALRLFAALLAQMARGNAVSIIPTHAELTTQQAAEFLNVSRPFVIQLIEAGKLPCRMVGTHRRIRIADLLAYKRKVDADRLRALEELAEQAQDLSMGYEE